jgi:hypothetical protein
VRLTYHARQRMQEMGVTEAEVLAAVTDPGVTYLGRHHSPPETISIRGPIGVATKVQGDEVIVLTVLWPCREYERAS